MKDIQSQIDTRRVNIKKVGVKTISYPISLLDKKKRHQHTVASVNMYVNLPHKFKGTHMSRFIEILNMFHGEIDLKNFHTILEEMKQRLDAEASHVEIQFPFFLSKEDGDAALKSSKYECKMHGSIEHTDELELTVSIPISRSLARGEGYGSVHSSGQWGSAVVAVRFRRFVWIEDLINLIENSLKNMDSNINSSGKGKVDLSVEGFCRVIFDDLSTRDELKWYSVSVENLGEGYSTFAFMESEPVDNTILITK